jgi:hypothetical protein
MHKALPNITGKEVVKFGIHEIEPEFVAALREHFPEISPKEIIQFGIHEVTPDFVAEMREEMRAQGYDDLSNKHLVAMYLHDFDPAFVGEMRSVGFENLPVRQLVELWAHNVDARYVERVRARQGNVTPQELVDLRRAERRTAERQMESFYHDLRKLGFRRVSTGELLDLIALGIDTAAIEAAQADDPTVTLHTIIRRKRAAGDAGGT